MVRVRQARWEGAMRNEPVRKPPLAHPLARIWWMWARQQRTLGATGAERLPNGVMPVGGEAVRKACGVLAARLQGKSWAPSLSNGQW